jgi:hypothetical protein
VLASNNSSAFPILRVRSYHTKTDEWISAPSPQHYSKQCFYHTIRYYQSGLAVWSWAGDQVRKAAVAASQCPSWWKDLSGTEKTACLKVDIMYGRMIFGEIDWSVKGSCWRFGGLEDELMAHNLVMMMWEFLRIWFQLSKKKSLTRTCPKPHRCILSV